MKCNKVDGKFNKLVYPKRAKFIDIIIVVKSIFLVVYSVHCYWFACCHETLMLVFRASDHCLLLCGQTIVVVSFYVHNCTAMND